MSIIYDALKKIQKSNRTYLDIRVDNGRKYSKYKVYVFYFLIICVGLFIGNIFFNFLNRNGHSSLKHTDEPLIKENSFAPVNKPPLEKKPIVFTTPEKKFRESLVLNGVFFSQNEGYALINNQIVKEGDVIGEGKVKRITLDEVELEYEGAEIKLPARK